MAQRFCSGFARIRSVSCRWRGARGFTLLELVIVMALLAFGLAMAVPMLSSGVSKSELKAAASELSAGLRSARGAAVTGNREVEFLLDVEARRYWRADWPEERKPKTLAAAIELSLYTARSTQRDETTGGIRFYPDGSSTGGRIGLAHGEAQYYVLVDWFTGRVSLVE